MSSSQIDQPSIEPYGAEPPWDIRLSGVQSLSRAMALRKTGMPYRWIAVVMWLYHGDQRPAASWNTALRNHGAEPKHYKNSDRLPPQAYARDGS